MGRVVKDSKIGNRESRSKLPARGRPYYRAIQEGLHLGYRKSRGRRGKPAGAGVWVARFYTGNTYRAKTIGTADDYADADGVNVLDFAQAQAAVQNLHAARANSAAGIAGPLTVATALELHLRHLEGEGQDVTNQKDHARAFIVPGLGDIEVAELTTKQLTAWRQHLAAQPPRVRTAAGEKQRHRPIDDNDAEAKRRRRSSAGRVTTTLKAALNYVWKTESKSVPSDSAWRRLAAFKNTESARIRYLTVAEAERLINAADLEFRPLVTAALQTGARYQELARLKVGDFNPDAGTVAIWQSKSGKPRHVVLTAEGAQFFRQLCAGRAPSEIMLPRSDGGAWAKSHQQQRMIAACKRAHVSPPIGIHGLRHTWASLSIMAGMPLQVAARNLGHVDTKMVERYYGHLAPSYITDEIRAHAPKFGIAAKSNVAVLR
ncbi:MAG: site-specific integrase [Xanthobacteraceae bacterium]|jgi:integrase